MRFILLMALAFFMVACSSGVKDYSSATALTSIKADLKVKPRWVKDIGYLAKNNHAQLPLVVVNDVLYYANSNGGVGALNVVWGKKHWSVSTGEIFTGGPGVGEGLIILGTREAEIVALDQNNGTERWRSRVSSEMLASPRINGDQIIIQTIDGKIVALETATGKQIWSYSHTIPALTLRGSSAPLIYGERVLAGFADGKLVSLERNTGKLQWVTSIAIPKGRADLERLVDIDGLFAVVDDTVYVTTYQGNIAAVSVVSGDTLWSREISSFTGLVIGDSRIYLSDAEGYVWALDRRSGGTLWRQDKLAGREPSLPVLIGDSVAVGDFDGYVHWLSTEDGQIVARQSLEHIWRKATLLQPEESDSKIKWRSVSVSPLAVGNRLYVRDNLGALAAFEIGARTNTQ